MITYGLIGYPLSHSWSADYFSSKFRSENITGRTYRLFPLSKIDELPDLILREEELIGLNVTIPYKKDIIGFLDELDPVSEEIGAVNTILISREGHQIRMKGYNTDAEGFRLSADLTGHQNALILGTGGAAMAVAYVLKHLGIEYYFVSRTRKGHDTIRYQEITRDMMHCHTLIINATPLGMHPDTESVPHIPYEYLDSGHFLYELVYNPEKTRFLQKGIEHGAKIQNGLEMLKIQAESSFSIWEKTNLDNFTPSGF